MHHDERNTRPACGEFKLALSGEVGRRVFKFAQKIEECDLGDLLPCELQGIDRMAAQSGDNCVRTREVAQGKTGLSREFRM